MVLNDGGEFPYGFGWQLNDWPADSPVRTGVPMIRHGGTIPGFRAGYFRWPTHGLAVVVLTNLEDAPLDGLVANIATRVVPELKTASPASNRTNPEITGMIANGRCRDMLRTIGRFSGSLSLTA